MTTGTGSDAFNIPELDPDSPEPPTKGQIVRYIDAIRETHRHVAAVRGFEGEILCAVGIYDVDEPKDAEDGPPACRLERDLILSNWENGRSCTSEDVDGVWTVQNNLLFVLWHGGILTNIVTLVRPLKGAVPVAMTVPVEAFACGPVALQAASIKDDLALTELERFVVEDFVELCSNWGDWGSIPWDEFFVGVEENDVGNVGLVLYNLERRGIIRVEKRADGSSCIQVLPPFIDLFDRDDDEIPANCAGTFEA